VIFPGGKGGMLCCQATRIAPLRDRQESVSIRVLAGFWRMAFHLLNPGKLEVLGAFNTTLLI
jgi:hypothetical protein